MTKVTQKRLAETKAFLGAFIATVNYHNEHDADGFVQSMWDARDEARALLVKICRIHVAKRKKK